MKASPILTLLAISVCTAMEMTKTRSVRENGLLEAARSSELGIAANSLTSKSSFRAMFNAHKRRFLNTSPEPQKYYPYFTIDFLQKRAGTVSVTHYGESLQQCVQSCRNHSDRCLAINYQHQVRTCQELETLGILSVDSNYVTCLINYKEGDDPCSEVYFLKNYNRPGFFYKSFHADRAKSSKDCCLRCKEDPGSRCKVWTYYTTTKICYLREVASPLTNPGGLTTGYGVMKASSITT